MGPSLKLGLRRRGGGRAGLVAPGAGADLGAVGGGEAVAGDARAGRSDAPRALRARRLSNKLDDDVKNLRKRFDATIEARRKKRVAA